MKKLLSVLFTFSTAFLLWWILDVVLISAIAFSALGHLPQRDGDFGFLHYMTSRHSGLLLNVGPFIGKLADSYLWIVAFFSMVLIPISLVVAVLKPIFKLPIDQRLWLLGIFCSAIVLWIHLQIRLGFEKYGYCFICWFDG